MSTGDEGMGQEWGEEEAGKRTREGGGECERVSMHLSVCVCARSFVYMCVCTLLDGATSSVAYAANLLSGFQSRIFLIPLFLFIPSIEHRPSLARGG